MSIKMLDGMAVKLLDQEMLRRENENRSYMLRLDPRALTLSFEMEAGLANYTELPDFSSGGWENPVSQVRGHFTGHWLSAAAMRYHETGDAVMKARADEMIEILERCQENNGDGWVGSIPEKYLFWIAEGKTIWAPQYVLQKTFMGLLDMYRFAGNEKALKIAERWAAWFHNWTKGFSREQMDDILDVETSGMLEMWAELYGITGDAMYVDLLDRYYRGRLFDRLLEGSDPLTNMHANTTIPEVIGCARAYEVTGDKRWKDIVEAYWKCAVTDRGSFVTGGQTLGEIWTPKHEMRARIGVKTQEHCTVYNMMRLADFLFRWSGEKSYLDYIEKNLFNGIMAQGYWRYEGVNDGIRKDVPRTGLLTYFLPMRSGFRKQWAGEREHFYCCHGTLVQANAAHNRYLYYQEDSTLYVAGFFDSDCETEIDGQKIKLSQRIDTQTGSVHLSTDSGAKHYIGEVTSKVLHNPEMKRIYFTVSTDKPVTMKLKIRVPQWTDASYGNDGYAVFDREWKNGDSVYVEFPMHVRSEAIDDDPDMIAYTYGPMVLAAETDAETRLELHGDTPESVIEREDEREWGYWTESFKTIKQPRGMHLKPLYKIGYEQYEIYFPVHRE